MTNTTTIDKVRNYQGDNSFVLKMKDALSKWGNLTPKQAEAAEKALISKPKVNMEQLPEEMKTISEYQGESKFVLDIKNKLMTYGTLTAKQVEAANKQIQKEKDKENTVRLNIPTVGETIKVGRSIGQKMKEQYGLKFNPILLDITKVLAVSPKAVKFSGKLTIKRGDVCTCCMKTLTDEFSMLTGMGKICASHVGVPYITDRSQAEKFRFEYMKRVDEIGEMEFWVPKSKIVKWEGKTEIILKMI
jgi:hypothetical protein